MRVHSWLNCDPLPKRFKFPRIDPKARGDGDAVGARPPTLPRHQSQHPTPHALHRTHHRPEPRQRRPAAALQRPEQGPDPAAGQGAGGRHGAAHAGPVRPRHAGRPGRGLSRRRRHRPRAGRSAARAVDRQHGVGRPHLEPGRQPELSRRARIGQRAGPCAHRPRPRPGDLPGAAAGPQARTCSTDSTTRCTPPSSAAWWPSAWAGPTATRRAPSRPR